MSIVWHTALILLFRRWTLWVWSLRLSFYTCPCTTIFAIALSSILKLQNLLNYCSWKATKFWITSRHIGFPCFRFPNTSRASVSHQLSRWLKTIQPLTLLEQITNYFVMWRCFKGLHVWCPYWTQCNVLLTLPRVAKCLFVISSLLWNFVKWTFTLCIAILKKGFHLHTFFFPWSCPA
jgi:hypothetical protein